MKKNLAIGDILQLKGLTLKMKNRIREHGTVWRIIQTGNPFTGAAVLVESIDTSHRRWIHPGIDVEELKTKE